MGDLGGGMLDPGGSASRDELKTQFMTREGTYHLMTLAEYTRPNRVGYANQAATTNAPVKVSFVNTGADDNAGEKIAFNYGRELFVYPYKGVRKAADLTKPIDKRVYKGTCPTCHDFGPPGCLKNENAEVIPLLVGFSGGQIQLIDPARKELSRLYNEERIIDKTRVTCLKWVPGHGDTFIVSHASGHLYTYQAELECCNLPPQYQYYKGGEGFTVYTCKTKSTKNPVYRTSIGTGPINEFTFSPCGNYLALVSQDGWLRVLHYDSMELVASARSYFGGLLCVCWSPDGKYIVLGGEDDLVTVYSFHERRVVVRGQGHKSWVSVVSFDVYNMAYDALPDGLDFSGSDDETSCGAAVPAINSPSTSHRTPLGESVSGPTLHTHAGGIQRQSARHHNRPPVVTEVASSGAGAGAQDTPRGSPSPSLSVSPPHPAINTGNSAVTCYRFGSVGQDTLICLWDLTEDVLKKSCQSLRARSSYARAGGNMSHSNSVTSKDSGLAATDTSSSNHSSGASSSSSTDTGKASSTSSLTHKLASLGLGGKENKEKEHKRTFSLPGRGANNKEKAKDASVRNKDKQANKDNTINNFETGDSGLGWMGCPRLNETPMLEPVVVKKIAHERLTSLVFKEECIVTACQDGYVCTWARPGRAGAPGPGGGGGPGVASPDTTHGVVSPSQSQSGGTGTIV